VITRKKAPYAGTEVSPDKSRSQIDQLLRDFGASGVQWTTLWDKARVEIQFGIEHDGKKVVVKIIAPTFTATHTSWNSKLGRNETVAAPNWAQSFRLLFYYLKAKLEQVTYGLREFEEEFLADTVVLTPGGEAQRVADFVLPAIENGRLRLAAPKARPVADDTEGRVVG
jgi:hypothetical protein